MQLVNIGFGNIVVANKIVRTNAIFFIFFAVFCIKNSIT